MKLELSCDVIPYFALFEMEESGFGNIHNFLLFILSDNFQFCVSVALCGFFARAQFDQFIDELFELMLPAS